MAVRYALIFLGGAAVLVVEVAFVRLFAPAFGTTIYATSSIIAVVLGALAAVYALGGRLADRRPHEKLLWGIAALSGAAILASVNVAAFALPALSRFDVRIGALFASLLLLPLPNVLLGMLSPFLIRLLAASAASQYVGIGRVTGMFSSFRPSDRSRDRSSRDSSSSQHSERETSS